MQKLIEPHGGRLQQLIDPDAVTDLKQEASNLKSWDLTSRQLCDIELLLNGAFSPLEGFLSEMDYQSVLESMRLQDGTLWPIPVTLDVSTEFADTLVCDQSICLRDQEGVPIAVLDITDLWSPDKKQEAEKVFATYDSFHPAVDYLFNKAGDVYLGGKLRGISLPVHYDFKSLRDSPAELREKFIKKGWKKVIAFQTRNPMHKAHQELTFRAAREQEANLLIHPVVGMTKPGDINHFSRVRCYEQIMKHYPEQTSCLSLLPLAMRMGGPREALWHAIIRKNYGCTHLIVGRDHAGPGKDSQGNEFYSAYEAQDLLIKYQSELGIKMVPFQLMVYVLEKSEYLPINEVKEEQTVLDINGTEIRRRLNEGLDIPSWFSYPEVVTELRKAKPQKSHQGFTIFFTGLSGSGKSTIANALMIKLLESGGRPVTLLDGDIVRKNLSSELGFSKDDRNLNIKRIGFVASEITKNRGIAICAPIAPYASVRKTVREDIEPLGGFIEVYVSTPLEECEKRDRKGLYAKARAGIIKEFTGISDPYEAPVNAEVVIETMSSSPDDAAHTILLKLESMGFIK